MELKRVYSIAAKEYKHIMRDPFTLGVAIMLPVIYVFFFGFVIDLDYKHMPVAVRDNDQSSVSRKFLQEMSSSGFFNLSPLHTPLEADRALNRNDVPAVMIIKKDFGANFTGGDPSKPGKIQLLLDGSDNAKAGITLSYVSLAVQKFNGGVRSDLIRTRFLFNPELNSRWFIVPALNTIIIGFMAIVLTALTVAKEWENGSMELLLSTPVLPSEIVAGKLIPYFALTLFDVMGIFVVSLLVFQIPFLGSFILFLIACCIYIIGALALGLFISVVTRAQQPSMQFAFAIGLLPGFIFAGFIFPVENMPLFFRILTTAFPQRWFLFLSRNLFLSDAGLIPLAGPFAGITIFCLLMIFIAIKKFKTDVEP